MPDFHVIGDSHVSSFNGRNTITEGRPDPDDMLKHFRTYRIGARLAYNFCKPDHPIRIHTMEVLKRLPSKSNIIISYGMVDCSSHILSQSIKQNRSIDDIADECVKRYFAGLSDLIPLKHNIHILGMHPFGETATRKNAINKRFNDFCLGMCNKFSFPFINIFDKLIDHYNVNLNGVVQINKRYYYDDEHLGIGSLPLYYTEINKFKKIF